MLTPEIKSYLDDLRDSGVVNMFGATPYLERDWGMTPKQAKEALMTWILTYGGSKNGE